jgi:Fic family protein
MKIPEKPPRLTSENIGRVKDIFLAKRIGFENVFSEANREYLYWNEFKYKALPEGIGPEDAWIALKVFSRTPGKKTVQITDKAAASYIVPESAQELLHQIDRGAGGLLLDDNPGHLLHQRDKERYIIHSLMEEAISSSMIEGAVTTRAVAREMLRAGRPPRGREERMVLNNYETMQKIKELAKQPLSPGLIRELHASISRGTLDDPSWEGAFRTEQNIVSDQENTELHLPPSFQAVPDSIDRMCRFAEDGGGEFVHPVIRGIILHFWLAYLHPFMDGNGRTARALFYWYMLRKGYRLFEYIPISRVILKRRIRYYQSFLHTELDENDMTYFIMYNLGAIGDAIEEVRKYIGRKQREARESTRFLQEYPGLNHRQRALLASALGKPGETYTIEAHAAVHGAVYQTARTDLLKLHEMGLLDMRKEGRRMVFWAVHDLRARLDPK